MRTGPLESPARLELNAYLMDSTRSRLYRVLGLCVLNSRLSIATLNNRTTLSVNVEFFAANLLFSSHGVLINDFRHPHFFAHKRFFVNVRRFFVDFHACHFAFLESGATRSYSSAASWGAALNHDPLFFDRHRNSSGVCFDVFADRHFTRFLASSCWRLGALDRV